MSKEIELKPGQWYRTRCGEIRYCIGESKAATLPGDKWLVEDEEGRVDTFCWDGRWIADEVEDSDLVEHLPDCDSFTWEPPKPKLQLRAGAWYKRGDGRVVGPCKASQDRDDRPWSVGAVYYKDDGTNSLRTYQHLVEEVPDPTPKPVYRPFASAAEFAPHRDRWICRTYSTQDHVPGHYRVSSYDDDGIWTAEGRKASYELMFTEGRKFDDGTPFGVEVK